MLSVDPLTRDNITMLRQFNNEEVTLRRKTPSQPAQRTMYLSEIARMRMQGRSEEALNHLERVLDASEDGTWVHGEVVKALLNHDDGRSLTAISTLENLVQKHGRHPHLRSVLLQFARLGHTKMPPSEPTKMEWVCDQETDWRQHWIQHSTAIPPAFEQEELKRYAWESNKWVGLLSQEAWKQRNKKNAHRHLPNEGPLGLYLHLTGLTVTIGGMPVDVGLPSIYDPAAVEKAGLLDL